MHKRARNSGSPLIIRIIILPHISVIQTSSTQPLPRHSLKTLPLQEFNTAGIRGDALELARNERSKKI